MSRNSRNGRGESDISNDNGMPLDQIIQLGEAAARDLNSPVYQLAHRMAVDQLILEWSQTGSKEREKRDDLWRDVQSMGRMAEYLRGFIERAQQVIASQAPEQRDQDYMDQQGFGLGDILQ